MQASLVARLRNRDSGRLVARHSGHSRIVRTLGRNRKKRRGPAIRKPVAIATTDRARQHNYPDGQGTFSALTHHKLAGLDIQPDLLIS